MPINGSSPEEVQINDSKLRCIRLIKVHPSGYGDSTMGNGVDYIDARSIESHYSIRRRGECHYYSCFWIGFSYLAFERNCLVERDLRNILLFLII